MIEKLSEARVAAPETTLSDPRLTQLPKISDYYKWSIEQAEHIRAGRFDKVDLLNVADEIEDVGKSEARALRSNLENVLVHMLKWELQPRRRSRSWMWAIIEHRARVLEILEDNPSLTGKWGESLGRAYYLARLRAARETGLMLKRFPRVLRLRSRTDHGLALRDRRELI